ncbi:hypothetical protein PG984_003920 [Apiospora sp. TS-2023a]
MDASFQNDSAILRALPAGSRITTASPHGQTNWSKGLRITVETDDKEETLFLKLIEREGAESMAVGEYTSQKELHQCIPENISPALAHGTLEPNPGTAFFLTKFHDLRPGVIDPTRLATILTKLHRISSSPTGKFGFPVTTFKGYIPVNNAWTDTWEEFFARQFKHEIAWEQSVRGADAEMEQVAEEFFDKVIPRLLRPLQSEGRNINPVLCHGDLWHGNIEFDVATQDPIMFDSCFDLSLMVAPRYDLGALHVAGYTKQMGVSEPREDFDDRLMLYHLRNELVVSGLWAKCAHLREDVKRSMRNLIDKYPEGLEGAEPIIKLNEKVVLHGPTTTTGM